MIPVFDGQEKRSRVTSPDRCRTVEEILWVSVGFEIWLAVFNFICKDMLLLTIVDLSVFIAFSVFGTVRWWMGYSSCGCSGGVELPVWFFVLLDAGIVVLLVVMTRGIRPVLAGFKRLSSMWQGWSSGHRGRLAGLVLAAILVIFLQIPYAAQLRAMVLGEPPVKGIARISGELLLGHESVGQIELSNRSGEPARIIGVERSCSCVRLLQSPASEVIVANANSSLSIVLEPIKSGPFHQRVVLYLDHSKQLRVNVDVLGFVKK